MVASKKSDAVLAGVPAPDAVAQARANRQAGTDLPPGTVVNARAGYRYSVIVTRDYTDKQLPALRKMLTQRGYRLADAGEFMIGEPDAEIWVTDPEIGDDEWKDEFIANLLNPAWLNLQQRRKNHGIARKVLEQAVKYHDHRLTPDVRDAAKVALERLIRSSPIIDLQVRN